MKSISEIKAEFSMAQPSQLAELMRRYADDPRSGVQKLLEKEGTDVWSHFLIANQYGTEQAHTEGKAGHG